LDLFVYDCPLILIRISTVRFLSPACSTALRSRSSVVIAGLFERVLPHRVEPPRFFLQRPVN
jgi:hypothetical protein